MIATTFRNLSRIGYLAIRSQRTTLNHVTRTATAKIPRRSLFDSEQKIGDRSKGNTQVGKVSVGGATGLLVVAVGMGGYVYCHHISSDHKVCEKMRRVFDSSDES